MVTDAGPAVARRNSSPQSWYDPDPASHVRRRVLSQISGKTGYSLKQNKPICCSVQLDLLLNI